MSLAQVSDVLNEVCWGLLYSVASCVRIVCQTQRTPLEEAVEGDDPDIVCLLMKAVSRVNKKVCYAYVNIV